jgi:hypothetical protein
MEIPDTVPASRLEMGSMRVMAAASTPRAARIADERECQPKQPVAGSQDPPAYGVALVLIGVEQGVRAPAVDGGGELPAEVGGILKTSVHPHPARWRVDMRGVSRQKHIADAVAGAWHSSLWKRDIQRGSCMP